MLTFLAYSVSAITFAKKIATDDRISASEDYINKFIKLLFWVTIYSNPCGYFWSKLLIMFSRSLNDGDFSQNPKVNFWQRGSISAFNVFGLEIRLEKNLTNEDEERHFSKKWI